METTPYEVKDNTFTIWLETKTLEGQNGPYEVMSGSGKVFGKEVYLNAYPKETKTGKKILSGTFKEKVAKPPQGNSDVAPF